MDPTSAACGRPQDSIPWSRVEAAIRRLARAHRLHRMSPFAPTSLRRAAVAVVLRGHAAGALEVLLVQRGHTAPEHAGELAFPGGMVEPFDRDLPATARRELLEETGVRNGLWELGCLPDAVAKGRIRFTPVVFRWEEAHPVYCTSDEVDSVLPLSLPFLLAAPWTTQTLTIHGLTREIPRLNLDPVPLWGATAFVLKRFLEALG